MILEDEWPIKIESGNWWASGLTRGARMKRARVGAAEKGEARLLTFEVLDRRVPATPITVKLTRVSPGTLDDDNLSTGFKHIRDGITTALRTVTGNEKLDDRPGGGIEWEYDQVKGKYAMLIAISWEQKGGE